MNTSDFDAAEDSGAPPVDPALAAALDAALQRALPAPKLPAGFHQRLRAALARSGHEVLAERRAQAEREHRQRAAELDSAYLRIRWATLGTLIGVAFASGVGLTLAMPWIRTHFGPTGVSVAPLAAAALFVLGVVTLTWRGRRGLSIGL